MRKRIKVSIQKPNKLLMSDDEENKIIRRGRPHPVGPEIPSFRALTNTLATEKTPQKTPPDRKQVSRGMNSLELLEFIHSRALISRVRKTFQSPIFTPRRKAPPFFCAKEEEGGEDFRAEYTRRARNSRERFYIQITYKTYLGDRVFKIGRLDAGLFHNLSARHLFCAML